jgi:Histidine kinase-like ATPase domain
VTAHPQCLTVGATSGMCHCWLAPAVEMAAAATGNWPLSPQPGPLGWTCFPRVATRTPGLDARAVRAARDFTSATVHRWGAAQRCEDITIVVSELLTNAFRHALPDPSDTRSRSPIRLGLLQPGPCVLCVVADPSHRAPVPKHLGLLAETGRGLQVIGALSDSWGYTAPSDMGKVVWAMFSTDGAPPRPGPRQRPRATGHQQAPAAGAVSRPSGRI